MGKQLELGLGSYPSVSLAEARSIAAENKALAVKGINPKYERQKPIHIPTFPELVASNVQAYLAQNPDVERKHVQNFK